MQSKLVFLPIKHITQINKIRFVICNIVNFQNKSKFVCYKTCINWNRIIPYGKSKWIPLFWFLIN